MAIDDDELRRALARACNRYYAEQYREFADRLGPVAEDRPHIYVPTLGAVYADAPVSWLS